MDEKGEVVVTLDEQGECVLVSRQNEEHEILSIIWEKPGATESTIPTPPEGEPNLDEYPSDLASMTRREYLESQGKTIDAPHTPEQAHGDALAAYAVVSSDGTVKGLWTIGDWDQAEAFAERHGWSIAPLFWGPQGQALTASGVPYVPESIRRLPGRMRSAAKEMQAQEPKSGSRLSGRIDEAWVWVDELEAALASAPAVPDGWILVPRKPTKDMCHAGCEVSVSPDVPAEIWNAMIVAAPTDGRDD